MDYNFGSSVLWFLSMPWLIDAVGIVSLAFGLFVAILKFGRG